MKAIAGLAIVACLISSCTTYVIPSLERKLGKSKGTVGFQSQATAGGETEEPIDIAPLIPYLKRADWSNVRHPFTVWKIFHEITLANGTCLQINGEYSFRIAGTAGEYDFLEEDRPKVRRVLDSLVK